MMELIPVLDLSQGRAVHARGGRRADYAPVRSVLAPERPGDPLLLARRYRERLGAHRCYVADLDALGGGARQLELLRQLADPAAGFGPGLMVDAAVTDAEGAEQVIAAGADALIVALETLDSARALAALLAAIGPDRLVLSLDLRDGHPLLRPGAEWPAGIGPVALAGLAVASGLRRLLVLDLARVGGEAGPALEVIDAVQISYPALEILSGGGVRGPGDLAALAGRGVRGALVATALHDGRIGYIASR
jgi:phosphoribosylformimino-5-aminoimidazole carboxamide ribotide isomerase